MPEVGNDKNATVERRSFSAAQNVAVGPERRSLRRSDRSVIGGRAEVAYARSK